MEGVVDGEEREKDDAWRQRVSDQNRNWFGSFGCVHPDSLPSDQIVRPPLQQRAPLLQEVGTLIGALDIAADLMAIEPSITSTAYNGVRPTLDRTFIGTTSPPGIWSTS